MLSLIGFLMVVAIIILLLKGKMTPVVVLVLIPSIAAIILGTSFGDLSDMVKGGIKTVSNNSVLFIFSIIFFCIMSDVGVFDIIVNKLVKIAGNNVIAITVATGIIGIIAHLDGATATTVLITIPTMYPIYKKMRIRPQVLLCLTACAMGVMNLLPWGGPVARAATVLGMDATDLWMKLIPIQIVGCVLTIGLAVLLGTIEKKRGAGMEMQNIDVEESEHKDLSERSRKLLPFNVLLTITVIGILVWNKLPSYYVFMLGLSLALVVNYPSLKSQESKIKEHASAALVISATMLAAGIMVGIMDGTGMIEAIAKTLTSIIPSGLGKFTHLIFGFTALPMGMLIGTDAYFFGLMPPIIEVGKSFGVEGISTAMAMLIGKNVSLMISPLVPATFLALGLVNIELKEHIKFCFKYLYSVSAIMIVTALVLGIIAI